MRSSANATARFTATGSATSQSSMTILLRDESTFSDCQTLGLNTARPFALKAQSAVRLVSGGESRAGHDWQSRHTCRLNIALPAVVDLPTPPLPEATATVYVTPGIPT